MTNNVKILQSKSFFTKEDAKPFTEKATLDGLDEWGKANPNDLQKVAKYLKDVCTIRLSADKQKVKMSDKYTTSAIGDLPAKYKKPNGNKNIELFIVEGDSAAGGRLSAPHCGNTVLN